jgi:hypothetical protein|tara:strand:+ start:649 stop:1131 length:483 start_codon:yes stop_codon:yes gene_type:complete
MGFTLDKVHNFVRDEETNRMVLQSKSPYKRFVREGEVAVIAQGGRFYSDGGQSIKRVDVPRHVWDVLRESTKAGVEALGLSSDDLGPTREGEGSVIEAPIAGGDQRTPTLSEVLMSLDHNNDAHWTRTNLPELNIVKDKFGRYCSRQTITEAIDGFKRRE